MTVQRELLPNQWLIEALRDRGQYEESVLLSKADAQISCDSTSVMWGQFVYRDERLAKAAHRVLVNLLSRRGAQVWLEPVFASGARAREGLCAFWYLSLRDGAPGVSVPGEIEPTEKVGNPA